MSHAPPFGCNEYPPGGARPDEEAFVSTEQQSPKHTIFLQRNSKVGVELSMAIVIEGYVNIQKCVETGSSFLYVAVDELDALLDQAINGTA